LAAKELLIIVAASQAEHFGLNVIRYARKLLAVRVRDLRVAGKGCGLFPVEAEVVLMANGNKKGHAGQAPQQFHNFQD
jgi:hypothetical protein